MAELQRRNALVFSSNYCSDFTRSTRDFGCCELVFGCRISISFTRFYQTGLHGMKIVSFGSQKIFNIVRAFPPSKDRSCSRSNYYIQRWRFDLVWFTRYSSIPACVWVTGLTLTLTRLFRRYDHKLKRGVNDLEGGHRFTPNTCAREYEQRW